MGDFLPAVGIINHKYIEVERNNKFMKEIRIGLLGLGNIGTGTYKALEMNREKIEKLVGGSVNITSILEKDIDRKEI